MSVSPRSTAKVVDDRAIIAMNVKEIKGFPAALC
jgi:hypothetical protein